MSSLIQKERLFTFQEMDFETHSMRSVTSVRTFERPGSDIKKVGYMKKMKTNKKKYFVLRSTSSSGPARLEYYDSEKKFKAGNPPKHPIHLHKCFNINKKSDSKHGKWGIVLYSNEGCLTVITETEEDQNSWLALMLDYQSEYLPCGDPPREHYDHVWPIHVPQKSLLPKGEYRLCLNEINLSFFRASSWEPEQCIPMCTVRTVATTDNSCSVEVGKYSPTGEGKLDFFVDDAVLAREMHSIFLVYMNALENQQKAAQLSLRRRTESHSSPGRRIEPAQPRPQSCFQASTSRQSVGSPNSPINPTDFLPPMRSRTHTGESRYREDKMEVMLPYVEPEPEMVISLVPEDMTPPSSPNHLDEQVKEYFEMDNLKNSQMTTSATQASYMNMGSNSLGQKENVTLNCHAAPAQTLTESYMPMVSGSSQPSGFAPGLAGHQAGAAASVVHHGTTPLQIHTFSEVHHSTLPTVREGGSNEGYFPMELPNSPASSSGILRPEPAKCMLSDDTTGLPPRTYSLGSRPVSKKDTGYMEMGPRGAVVADMSRATSAPHIINNLKIRKEREPNTESPSQSASPLSASLKSDDSDSFMEYIPMRPRTASDSFNYRPRTSSFGKMQPMSRPRSSSHGQGTRPFTKFGKMIVEQSRISLEPQHRVSQESSLPGSFESLRVSSESLRKTGHDIRKKTGSNASDYAEMRSTPSPQLKSEADPGYMTMQLGLPYRKSSPHRVRSDSNSSGRRPEVGSDRAHQQPNMKDNYTEMAPLGAAAAGADSYMIMEYGQQHQSCTTDKRPASFVSSSGQPQTDSAYFNMDMDASKPGRSASVENVDTYVIYDPQQPPGNKLRTGSVGAKDNKITRPNRKASSVSMSSSSPTNSGMFPPQPSVSTSSRIGGSSDSIRKASRQSSVEKNANLGKDFRKKSGSMGSKPSNVKVFFMERDKHQQGPLPSAQQRKPLDDYDDEYIEFSPSVTIGDCDCHHTRTQAQQHPGQLSKAGMNPQLGHVEDDAYTEYNPALPPVSKAAQVRTQKPPAVKSSIQPSSVQQARQVTSKDIAEYVGFEPGNIPPVTTQAQQGYGGSHPDVLAKGRASCQIRTSVAQDYVGYQPGAVSAQDYVGYQPRTAHDYVGYQPRTVQDYVGCQPGTAPAQCCAHHQSGAVQDYVGYQSGTVPAQDYLGSQPGTASAQCYAHRHSGTVAEQDYVGYQPGTAPAQDHVGYHSGTMPAQGYVAYQPRDMAMHDYVGYQPGTMSMPGHSYSGHQPGKATAHDYVGYQPGHARDQSSGQPRVTTAFPFAPLPPAKKQEVKTESQEYVGFEPGQGSTCQNVKAPGNAISYIQKPVTTEKPAQKQPPYSSPSVPLAISQSKSETKVNVSQPCFQTPSQNPEMPTLQAESVQNPSMCSSKTSVADKKSSDKVCLGSSDCSPSSTTTSTSQQIPQPPVTAQQCLSGQKPSGMSSILPMPKAEESQYLSLNVAIQDAAAEAQKDLPAPARAVSLISDSTPKLTELKVDVTPGSAQSPASKGQAHKQSSSAHRSTTCSPAHHPGPDVVKRSESTTLTPEPSPEILNNNKLGPGSQPFCCLDSSKRHKHLSGPEVTAAPHSSRQKHPSGSSQKNRKTCSDTEKLFVKVGKSDSLGGNSSDASLSSKSRRRMPSGDKSPGSSTEKSPLSPSRGGGLDFFCGEASPTTGKALEAKMAVVEAKIRHSVGDVTALMSPVTKDGHVLSLGDMTAAINRDGHGLVRPGSSPCMQNLESGQDMCSRSTGSDPTSNGGLHFSSSSRSRHSIPDLNFFQQVSSSSEQKANVSGGSGDSCGSEACAKPLNYVSLDLGASEGQGDADWKVSRCKSRNSSDADERQPPLSYAEIDFARSQNLNKGKSLTTAGGDKS